MNILIIEDEIIVSDILQKILNKVEHANIVDAASNYTTGLHKAITGIFDIVLLDIFLDERNASGIDLCKRIRGYSDDIIIVIITGHHSIDRLKEAFDCGANDYITKPFNRIELPIRIKRWAYQAHKIKFCKQLSYNELKYDIQKNEFLFKNKKLRLTRKEKHLLKIFIKNPEKLISSEKIQEKLWGDIDLFKKRNIRSNIQYLRNALGGNCQDWIKTITGEGYILQK